MLRLPYLLNILILVPVCWAMYSGTGRTAVFEGKVNWSDDLASLVAELWTAINTENLDELSDFAGYRREFLQLFGFEVDGVDYEADVDPQVPIPQLLDV